MFVFFDYFNWIRVIRSWEFKEIKKKIKNFLKKNNTNLINIKKIIGIGLNFTK